MQLTAIRKPTVVVLLILTVALVFPALASSSPVSQKKARLREVQAKLHAVYDKADMAVEKYNQATSQLTTIQAQIKENEKLLKVAEYNLEIANQQLSARAENMYRTEDVGVVDVLFAARSFDDLVTQLDLMERLGNSDVDTVKSIAAYEQDIKNHRVKLAADRKAADRLLVKRAAQKEAVLALQSQLEDLTRGIKSDIQRLEQEQAAARAAAAQATDTDTGTPPSGDTDPGGPGHPEIVALAQQQLGKPYVYATDGPNTFDCSGLVMYCYAQIGISLPHAATLQQHMSQPVSLNNLQPGDLVFFGNSSWSGHVGIYVGGGTMINAPHSNAVVRYDSIAGAWIGGRL